MQTIALNTRQNPASAVKKVINAIQIKGLRIGQNVLTRHCAQWQQGRPMLQFDNRLTAAKLVASNDKVGRILVIWQN